MAVQSSAGPSESDQLSPDRGVPWPGVTDGFLLSRPGYLFSEAFLSTEEIMRQPSRTRATVKHAVLRVCVCAHAGTKKNSIGWN